MLPRESRVALTLRLLGGLDDRRDRAGGLAKGRAVVIRIPRSWNGPHAISFQQDFPVLFSEYKGKFRMDASDVRDAVLAAGSIDERIRLFRAERVFASLLMRRRFR